MKFCILLLLAACAAASPLFHEDELDAEKRFIEDASLRRFDVNIKQIFKDLKAKLLKGIDKQKLIDFVEKVFGKGSEMADALEQMINEKSGKYKQKLLDLIDRFLGEKEQFAVQHSLGDYWQKLKDYFKDLKIDLQEKYMKFGEWIKEVAKDSIGKLKDKKENLKEIAQEFIKHAKGVSKEVAVEALEFLRPYKEDLGGLYEQVKETVKDILKKKE